MRRALLVVTIAAVHAAITMWLILTVGGLVMSAFDGNRSSSALDAVGLAAVGALMLPLAPVALLVPHGWNAAMPFLGNTFFALNSLLWGVAGAWLFHRRRPAAV